MASTSACIRSTRDVMGSARCEEGMAPRIRTLGTGASLSLRSMTNDDRPMTFLSRQSWLAREVATTTPPTGGPEVDTRPRVERMGREGFGLASFYGWGGRDGR